MISKSVHHFGTTAGVIRVKTSEETYAYAILLYSCNTFYTRSFEPPVTEIMLSPGVSDASPRNGRFAPLGFYWIPTYSLISVYRP